MLNSFENISLQTNENAPDAPKQSQKGFRDLLGHPSGKFNYKVFYSKPPFNNMPIESIVPIGWGDEFDDEKLLDKNETCTVEAWKDEVMKEVAEEMQE